MLPRPAPADAIPVDSLARLTSTRPFFLRAEALAAGLSDKSLRALMRAGVVRRLRHGTFALAEHWDGLDREQRHVLVARSAVARMRNVALSHVTAALVHGMEVWGVDLDLVHVTRKDAASGRIESGVHHHECLTLDTDLTEVDGVEVVNPARAALETGILGGTEAGLVAAESGMRARLFTPDDLAAQYQLLRTWPGAQPLQLVHRLADPSTESVAESRCGFLFWRLGLPAPVRQLDVYDARGVFIGRADFAWPRFRVIVEFDGDVKYRRFRRAGETIEEAVLREKRREDALRAAGWIVIRLSWSDLAAPARVASLVAPHLRSVRPAV